MVEKVVVKKPKDVKKEVIKKEPLPEPGKLPIYTYDFNTMQCTKHAEDVKIATLEAGPNGFLVANFGQAVHSTELSNLMLLVAPKTKNDKAIVLKKPAAAPKAAAAPEAASVADPAEHAVLKKPAAAPKAAAAPEAPEKRSYQVLWYKNGNNVGIRERFGGKKQIFSFGGKLCTKSKAELLGIANDVVGDLHEGMNPLAAKEKARGLASAV